METRETTSWVVCKCQVHLFYSYLLLRCLLYFSRLWDKELWLVGVGCSCWVSRDERFGRVYVGWDLKEVNEDGFGTL